MTDSKRTTSGMKKRGTTRTRKTTASKKRPAATTRKPRQRREVAPMTEAVRRAGAAAVAKFEEMMMDQEGTGFLSANTPVVKGPMADSKMVKRVKVEDENGVRHTAVVQVTFR